MEFQWPYLLGGLALMPVLIAGYILSQRRRRRYAVRFTNLALLREVAGPHPGLRRHIPPALFLLGLAALLVSLARPTAVLALPQNQAAVVLVLDVSGSMAAEDLKPDRLTAAKQAAQAFVRALPSDLQVGLVTFSTSANVVAPLSAEHDLVLRAIDRLAPGGGTAIGDGLNAALDQLALRPTNEGSPPPPGIVVLLSDGQSQSGRPPQQAAARAQAEGVQVYTVGIGQRGAVPLVSGGIPAILDERTLQEIARQTGGEYFYAAESTELERIYTNLSTQISWVEERTEVTPFFVLGATLLLVASGSLSLLWFQRFP